MIEIYENGNINNNNNNKIRYYIIGIITLFVLFLISMGGLKSNINTIQLIDGHEYVVMKDVGIAHHSGCRRCLNLDATRHSDIINALDDISRKIKYK